jgi:neutral ceramidase
MDSIRSRGAGKVLLLLLALLVPGVARGQGGALRVGAARVEITPPGLDPATIRDPLYVRAVVIDDGVTRAALISADQAGSEEALWSTASREIAAEIGVPVENVLISVTHTHSAGGPTSFMRSPALPGALIEVVRQARSRMRPAVMGFGKGSAYLNVNRDAIHPTTRRWYQGPNLEGVSDKTVSVISFWTPDGAPIAAYYSYAMHPVNFYQSGYISADFPGEAARLVEQVLGNDVVTLFVQGPSGDQNPLYTRISSPVPAATQVVRLSRPAGAPNAAAGPGAAPAGPDSLRVAVGVNETVRAAGVILGQEVLRVMYTTTARSGDARIRGAQKMVTCPGRTRLDTGREGMVGEFADGPDVNIRVGMLRIGSVALATVNAEVYTEIGLRLKRESPLANLMPITLTNGSAGSGYIPNDASFSHNTFQVLGSRLKPGCAEGAIASAALELTSQTMN